mgnify:CR=1 FL=1
MVLGCSAWYLGLQNADAGHRDVMDSTVNYGGHQKFVDKWLAKLAAE